MTGSLAPRFFGILCLFLVTETVTVTVTVTQETPVLQLTYFSAPFGGILSHLIRSCFTQKRNIELTIDYHKFWGYLSRGVCPFTHASFIHASFIDWTGNLIHLEHNHIIVHVSVTIPVNRYILLHPSYKIHTYKIHPAPL